MALVDKAIGAAGFLLMRCAPNCNIPKNRRKGKIVANEKKFEKLADNLLNLMGGKENIKLITHCVSRLRVQAVDKSLVSVEEIEKYECVMGTQWSGNELHIIIGQSVPDLYELVNKKTGLGGGEVEIDGTPVKKGKISLKSVFSTILDSISGSYVPLIPILITAGFVKVLIIVLEMIGVLTSGSPTHTLLTFVGDAGFYFLPVFAGYTSAKKFGANPYLGMMMGGILIHPTFIAAVNEASPLTVFGLNVPLNSYSSSFVPIILCTAVMAPIEKFIAKHSPEAARIAIEPFLTTLIMLPLALCVLAPIGSVIGEYLAVSIYWIYSKIGFVAVAIVGAIWPLCVLTGMHTAFVPYIISAVESGLGDAVVWPAGIIAAANQGVACLAVALKTKNKKIKSIGVSCGVTALSSSVFEPALFSLTFRYRTPLYASMLGGIIGGVVAGIGKSTAYAMTGTTNLAAIAVFVAQDMKPFWFMIAAVIIGLASTFVLTLLFWHDEDIEKYN